MWTRTRPIGLPLGVMLQPGNSYVEQVADYTAHAADNGCFSQGPRFEVDTFLTWLATVPRAGCLFAVAPDVYGNAAATRCRSLPVLPQIRALGFPAAYVAQDGETPETAPWDAFDVLFLGGIGRWKLGEAALTLCAAARRRGTPVHMGRVNSLRRLQAAQLMGCESADGTYLRFGPDANWPAVRRWLRVTSAQQPLFVLGAGSLHEEVWRVER